MYSYTTKIGANIDLHASMGEPAQDDNQTQRSGSIVSGLTSLESDADDFDRLMIQNARDERRLQDALRGQVQPFRKARQHPRVGLTLENLARNNARDEEGTGGGERERERERERGKAFKSPSSSSGSTRSNPAIRPPAQWGRKGRVRSNWLRAITSDEEQMPGAQEDTIDRLMEDETPRQTGGVGSNLEADLPHPSIEDSPLSRKSAHGTPGSMRRTNNIHLDREPDWDFTLDFNEASMIASTPYVPRSTVLDDIRQREMESLKEQTVATNRLDRIRENSLEETRRPSSSSRTSLFTATKSATTTTTTTSTEQVAQVTRSPQGRERKRTNSWKIVGRSQAVTGESSEQAANAPIIMTKKSSETVGMVDSRLLANADTNAPRPPHRREDSHDLLRRLARVSSSTPSPGRVTASRPQTAPASQPDNTPSKMTSSTPALPSQEVKAPGELTKATSTSEKAAVVPEKRPPMETPAETEPMAQSAPALLQPPTIPDIDSTPMPVERSPLNAKTPIVTGAWIDTPGPRTAHRPTSNNENPRPRSRSPRKSSPGKKPLQNEIARQPREQIAAPLEPARPTLPRSALEAIVEEARAHVRGPLHEDQYGDSTIDSLEDLIADDGEGSENVDPDEDTLQGLELPTEPPRTEAERQRRRELVQLHKMNQRLRNARTSIRDASRGIKRVEYRVEHGEENGQKIKIVHRDCPCVDGHHTLWSSAWTSFKRLFYQPASPKRWGLTWLAILTIAFWVWFISETVAWYVYMCVMFFSSSHLTFPSANYCHPIYATRMVGYGVDMENPRPFFPYAIPTLTYRYLLKPFWIPLWALVRWIGRMTHDIFFDMETARPTSTQTMRQFTATRVLETFESDRRMFDDEFA
jgi:hypothetical protein